MSASCYDSACFVGPGRSLQLTAFAEKIRKLVEVAELENCGGKDVPSCSQVAPVASVDAGVTETAPAR